MVNVGLLVRIVAAPGREDEVAAFLKSAQPLAEAEDFTPVWFAYRATGGTFYITDAFADDDARQKHLAGPIAAALMAKAPELLAEAPQIVPVDVLAAKIEGSPRPIEVGLLVRIVAAKGREETVAAFLKSALPLAEAEDFTPAWFAYRESADTFYITDAFADDAGRQKHLAGPIAAALMAQAAELLAEAPTITSVDVLAAKLPPLDLPRA